jgi:K+/H+ antiporter YhaU regulatory subunit KhtT
MSFELLGRIQQELSITGSAIYETVLALSERANRKVQVLRLHNHASNLLSQIEQGHGDLGRHIVALSAKRSPLTPESSPSSNQLGHVLGQAGDRIQQLKQTLLNVDSQIRELKLETIHHELLTLQQDLSLRTAAIERLTIVRGAPVIGKRLAEVALPPSVRLVTILRGPFLVSPDDTLVLRADDILIMVGLQVDLALVSSDFTHVRNGTSA